MLVIQLNVFMVILLSLVAVHAFYRLERKAHAAHRLFLAVICLTILILILEIESVKNFVLLSCNLSLLTEDGI